MLGHGLCGSRFIFDSHADYSLARHLARHGYDTWAVDLRGRNRSWPEGGPDRSHQWTFDDFVAHDLPTAVATACEASGAAEAFWIGTEMSGLAFYAAAIAGTTGAAARRRSRWARPR